VERHREFVAECIRRITEPQSQEPPNQQGLPEHD
jgi:hypothetical protein